MDKLDFVYVWADGRVEVLDQAYMVKSEGKRPVMIGLIEIGDGKMDASRQIQARRAMEDGGVLVDLVTLDYALEAMYEALIADTDELVKMPANAAAGLQSKIGASYTSERWV